LTFIKPQAELTTKETKRLKQIFGQNILREWIKNTEEMVKIGIYSIIIVAFGWVAISVTSEIPQNLISPARFEIKIQNDQTDELLEITHSLEDALTYLKQYGTFHNDLFVYDSNGELVADSTANN